MLILLELGWGQGKGSVSCANIILSAFIQQKISAAGHQQDRWLWEVHLHLSLHIKCTFVHAQNKCQGLPVLPLPSLLKTHRVNNYNTERFATSSSWLYCDKWQFSVLCRHTGELQTTEWGAGGEESCTEVNERQLSMSVLSYIKVTQMSVLSDSVNFLISQFEVSTSAISILNASLAFREILIHALICTVM